MNMKAKTFKALLTGIILLCSITSMYAQQPRDMYWTGATSSDFNDFGNWIAEINGVRSAATSAPSPSDNVFFTIEGTSRKVITVSPSGDGSNVANMANLTVTESGYSFTSNVAYNITGSIDVLDDFEITQGTVSLINDEDAPRDAEINIGSSGLEKAFGNTLIINKENQKVTLQSPINIRSAIQINGGSFNSNKKDITAISLTENTSASTDDMRSINYSYSTITLTGAMSLISLRVTHDFSHSNFIVSSIGFGGINGVAALLYELNNLTIQSSSK